MACGTPYPPTEWRDYIPNVQYVGDEKGIVNLQGIRFVKKGVEYNGVLFIEVQYKGSTLRLVYEKDEKEQWNGMFEKLKRILLRENV